MKRELKRSFIREILEHTNSDTISFAGGLPDEKLFPHKALQDAAHKALSSPQSLQYSTSTGYAPLKEQIAQFYNAKGFPTSSQNIIITSGSQQALDIISRLHSGKGITIEKPSYLGALNIFILNNMNTTSFDILSDEVDMSSLESSLEQNPLVYLIPDYQNPTGVSYSTNTRREIAILCKKYNTILIEDAPYSEIYFGTPMTSISSIIPNQSFHLGSFSKTLAPALRIGWIRAEDSMLQPLISYKEATDLHTSTITQKIVSYYLNDPSEFENHKAKLRARYHDKMLYFAKMLTEHLPQFTFTLPKGGMFIYGSLTGTDTMQLIKESMNQGVVFVPGMEFGGKYDEIRFNYTHSTHAEIEQGLLRIASALSTLKSQGL